MLYHGYSDSKTELKHLWLRLQNPVFLSLIPQALHTWIQGYFDILLCRSAKALSGGMGPFLFLCREVCLGSCQGSGRFTQGPSQLSQRPSPVVSAVCLGPSSGFLQTRCSDLSIMFVPSCSQLFTFLIDGVQMDCWEPPEQQNFFYSSSVTAKSLNTHANVILPF